VCYAHLLVNNGDAHVRCEWIVSCKGMRLHRQSTVPAAAPVAAAGQGVSRWSIKLHQQS
jgi:hypothetical protein